MILNAMDNPVHVFNHLSHGCDPEKSLVCAEELKSSCFSSKDASAILLNDISHENEVCFSTSLQDGDHSELFYSIVCGSDLPVGENVSISSPHNSTTNDVKFIESASTVFRERVDSLSSVDVVVHDMDEPLGTLALSVPDFKLTKIEPLSDKVKCGENVDDQRKKINESISAIAKSLGLEDLLPYTFQVDSSKDMFHVTSLEKEDSSISDITKSGFFTPDSPVHLSCEDLLDSDAYAFLSPHKKKCSDIDNGDLRLPLSLKDEEKYILSSKEETMDKTSLPLGSTSSLSISEVDFMHSEPSDEAVNEVCKVINEASVECILEGDTTNFSMLEGSCEAEEQALEVQDEEHETSVVIEDASENSVPVESNEVVVEDTTCCIENVEDAETIEEGSAVLSIATDKLSKKMQIIVTTSEGQQLFEFDTDALGIGASLNVQGVSEDGLTQNVICLSEVGGEADLLQDSTVIQPVEELNSSILDEDYDDPPAESISLDPDIVEFVNKISSTTRGKQKHWVCPVKGCGQVLNKECKLRVHMINHKGARPYKCDIVGCDWAFTTPYRLRRHIETHVGKKDFVCDYNGCNRSFTTIYNLNTHKKRHIWPNSLLCPADDCNLSFANRRKMELHLRVHKDVEAPYKCNICGKKYYSANCIASHYRTHQYSEDDFSCPFQGCEKKYEKLCRLKQHIRYHTGERPYTCQVEGCKWSFMSASKLTRHMRKHTGERKFVCTEPGCGKSFMRPEHLKGHIVIHSGAKPFQCPHENCNARFTAKSSLYVHVKKHSTNGLKVVFPCPISPCLKQYNNKALLKQHIVKTHQAVLREGKKAVDPKQLKVTLPVATIADGREVQTLRIEPLPVTGMKSNRPQVIKAVANSNKSKVDSRRPVKLVNVNSESKLAVSSEKTSTQHIVHVEPEEQTSPPKASKSSEMLTTGRLLQENFSGSARTDYCCNISNSNSKLWLLPNRVKLGVLSNSEDLNKFQETSTFTSCNTSQKLCEIHSPDVMLASPLAVFPDHLNDSLVQSHFLTDEPTVNSIMYQEDGILSNSSAFVSELPMAVSLLSDSESDGSDKWVWS